METDSFTDKEIKEFLSLRRVAVIGMSKHPNKAAHYVPQYLSENGYDIIPINPTANEISGKKCFDSISDVASDVDIIDIFRPSDKILSIIKEAVKKKPKVIWLQEGIHNIEAEEIAKKEGIKVVFNRCMLAEHMRLKL
jgi:hypothetical protein